MTEEQITIVRLMQSLEGHLVQAGRRETAEGVGKISRRLWSSQLLPATPSGFVLLSEPKGEPLRLST